MASCREVEPLLTPFVDDLASGSERALVEEHLRECHRCRSRARSEAGGRLILKSSSHHLRMEAPEALRARCQPPLPRKRSTNQSRSPFPWLIARPVRRWAMAAVVLMIVAGIAFSSGGGARLIAAELALDHLKCFALFERASSQGDAAILSNQLRETYGWRVKVPPAVPSLELQLVGGRRCFSTDGRVAHILYRHQGRPLSLFVIPGVVHRSAELAVVGHEAIMWSQGGMTFVVVAREARNDLARVAAHMRNAVE